MNLRSLVRPALITVALMGLSACNWYMEISCPLDGGKCTGKGGVSGPIGRNSASSLISAIQSAADAGGTVDLSTLYIDTSGTTFSLPSSGPISLVVKDSSGTTLGTNTFNYTHSGAQIVFQNPSAVSSWLSGYSNAASLDYSVDEGVTPQGTQTISNALYYQGTQQAAASQTFNNCPKLPQTHGCPIQ